MAPLPIAFGPRLDWEPLIREHLDGRRYTPTFAALDGLDLSVFAAVIPLSLPDYATLRRRPELTGRAFLLPSARVTALCDDKLSLAKWLVAEGFAASAPVLRTTGSPYPYVWKRRWGEWGAQCRLVRGPDDEDAAEAASGEWFGEALAPGATEFATHLLRVGGVVRYASTVTYEMNGQALVRGAPAQPLSAQIGPPDEHLPLFEAVLTRLGYEGTACVNYKLVRGVPRIFEINPRFGGSLAMDVTAYLDAYRLALARR